MFEYALDDEEGFHPLEDVDGQYLLELTINSTAFDRMVRIRNESDSIATDCAVPWVVVEQGRPEGSVKNFRLKVLAARLPPLSYMAAEVQLGADKLRLVVVGNRMVPTARPAAAPVRQVAPVEAVPLEVAPPAKDAQPAAVPEMRLRRTPVPPAQPVPQPIRPRAKETPDLGIKPAAARSIIPPPEKFDSYSDHSVEYESGNKGKLVALALVVLLAVGLGGWGIHSWLSSRPAQVLVESRPTGAVVTVKNAHGVTPFELKLAPGEYAIRLTLPGYKSHTETVKLEPAQDFKLMTTLEVTSSSLSVTSTPTRANVFLDGKPSGITPLHLKGLRSDTQVEVKVTRKGYLDFHGRVTLGSGGENEVAAVLKKSPASVFPAVPRPAFRPSRAPSSAHYYRVRPGHTKPAPRPSRPHKRRRRRMSQLDVIIHRMATGQQ
jgi:hypothetical protein